MHTLETVSEGSWGRPRRLYPESVITNYQEKALRRSLSLLLLAGANALHASRHHRLHLHQSSAVAHKLSLSRSLSVLLSHLLSLSPLSRLLPLSTPLYLLQLYHHLVFFNFISWRQKKKNGSITFFKLQTSNLQNQILSERQSIFFLFLIFIHFFAF